MGAWLHGRRAYRARLFLGGCLPAIALLWPSLAAAGGALPTNGAFTAGSGIIAASGSNGITVTQSTNRGIVTWQDFSIGAGNFVQINNGSGATLNRVTSSNPSSIAGSLSATGSVYLINPAGIIVMPGGQVVTGGSFVASTRDTGNDAFMQGNAMSFAGSSSGDVVNQGSITANNGDVVLIGQAVNNTGVITAPQGTANLVAADSVLLKPQGDARIYVKAALGSGNVTNSGTVAAAQVALDAVGGDVYALAGNNGGLLSATGVAKRNGHVWLTAGNDMEVGGTVTARNANGSGGKIDATAGANGVMIVNGAVNVDGATGAGGTAVLTAGTVALNSTARISANGATKGGTVLLGGDRHGGSDPSLKLVKQKVANAEATLVAPGAQISANGDNGDGGNVVLWSEQATVFQGAISSRGGANQGNGGFVEVSSKGYLDYNGSVDTTAPKGQTGTLLLDPAAIDVQEPPGFGGYDFPAGGTNSGLYTFVNVPFGQVLSTQGGGGGTNNAQLFPSQIVTALQTSDVILQATGTIDLHFSPTGIVSNSGNSLAIEAGVSAIIGSDFGASNIAGGLFMYAGVTGFTSTFTNHVIAAPTLGGAGNVVLGANVTVGSPGFIAGAVSTANLGPMTLTSGGQINFTGTGGMALSGNVTLNSSSGNGGIALSNVAAGSNNLTLVAGSGAVTLNGVAITGTLLVYAQSPATSQLSGITPTSITYGQSYPFVSPSFVAGGQYVIYASAQSTPAAPILPQPNELPTSAPDTGPSSTTTQAAIQQMLTALAESNEVSQIALAPGTSGTSGGTTTAGTSPAPAGTPTTLAANAAPASNGNSFTTDTPLSSPPDNGPTTTDTGGATSSPSLFASVVNALSSPGDALAALGALDGAGDKGGGAFVGAFVAALANGSSVADATAAGQSAAAQTALANSSTSTPSANASVSQQFASGDPTAASSVPDGGAFQSAIAQGMSFDQAMGASQQSAAATSAGLAATSVPQGAGDAAATGFASGATAGGNPAFASAMADALANGASPADAYAQAQSAVAARDAAGAQQGAATPGQQVTDLMATGNVAAALALAGLDPGDLGAPGAKALAQALADGQPADAAIAQAREAAQDTDSALTSRSVATSDTDQAATDMAAGRAPKNGCAQETNIVCDRSDRIAALDRQTSLPATPATAVAQKMASGKATSADAAQAIGRSDNAATRRALDRAFAEGGAMDHVLQNAGASIDRTRRAESGTALAGDPTVQIAGWAASGELTPRNPSLRALAQPLKPEDFIAIIANGIAKGESLEQAARAALAARAPRAATLGAARSP